MHDTGLGSKLVGTGVAALQLFLQDPDPLFGWATPGGG